MAKQTPIQAIRSKCMDCMNNQKTEIRACPVVKCSLWPYRLGIHAYTQKNLENPFLQACNFVGLEDKEASETINTINKKGDLF